MKFFIMSLVLFVFSAFVHAEIIMGVVPQQSPLKLLRVWSPVANYLSQELGEQVSFKTEKSIPEFEKALYAGEYDFAYMNPYHYVVAHKKQGYKACVRANKEIRGILVMQKDKTLEDIKDKNARFLFPAPYAFAATLLTQYELLQQYNINVKSSKNTIYVNSHDSVYKGVSRGFGTIGGGIQRTYKNLNDKATKDNLHIVHTTKPYPSHPFAVKPEFKKKEALTKALLGIPSELLQSLSMKGLKKIDDTEYDSVRVLSKKLRIMP